ncbi:MAG: hypothetical protein ACRD2A_19510, partial [Vicinamibacterales bacterium]
HTGWAACVVVTGTPKKPGIVANTIIDLLDDSERFCFHMAAEMKRPDAEKFLVRVRAKALAQAKRALALLLAHDVAACAIVAKADPMDDLDTILAAHPRIHTAEGRMYRDVLREACTVPVQLVPPKSLDITPIGKLAGPPWGRDQKLAALAAWSML